MQPDASNPTPPNNTVLRVIDVGFVVGMGARNRWETLDVA